MLRMQVNKIVGLGAPVEFVTTLEELANAHDANMEVDVIRAYHFGARFIVEASHPSSIQSPPSNLLVSADLNVIFLATLQRQHWRASQRATVWKCVGWWWRVLLVMCAWEYV